MRMLAGRLVNSGSSLIVLCTSDLPHEGTFDGAAILRTSYDAMLQGLYIMVVSEQRISRATLYLNFMDVERKKRIELADRNDTDMATQIARSSLRASREPLIQAQYDRIKAAYATKKGGVREKWYPGTLRHLAQEVGLESEYEWLQNQLSGVIHSSPLTLEEGPSLTPSLLINWHFSITFRLLGAYAEHVGVDLNTIEQNLMNIAWKNFLDLTKGCKKS